MHRITASPRGWPLHDAAASRALETAALRDTAPQALMQRAGLAVAKLALALAPAARRIAVMAGPGNNGGDGFVAATRLHEHDFAARGELRVFLASDADRLPPDAAAAWAELRRAGVPWQPFAAATTDGATGAASDGTTDGSTDGTLDGRDGPAGGGAGGAAGAAGFQPDLVIDALLGLGARRVPQGAIAEAIAQVARWRAAGARVLAVDLPSGLQADTGEPLSDAPGACVSADATLALLTLKPGLFTGRGRDFAGEVWFDGLGGDPPGVVAPSDGAAIDAAAEGATATAMLAARPAPPRRRHAQHKGSFGDVIAVGGAPGMGGALRLAAQAALLAGAGRVHVSALAGASGGPAAEAPGEAAGDPLHPGLMTRPRAWALPAPQLAAATVVCGCGGGDAVRAALPPLLAHAGRLVLDADALNAIAANPALAALLPLRAARGLATVLTPHPLEAARLLGGTRERVQADRLAAARTLAERTRAVVVLKGSGTVVAAPGAAPSINPSGNALLASAGTGDVLAGWIAGTLAGGATAREAALAAVYWHGAAADRAFSTGRRTPLVAEDLAQAMAEAIRAAAG